MAELNRDQTIFLGVSNYNLSRGLDVMDLTLNHKNENKRLSLAIIVLTRSEEKHLTRLLPNLIELGAKVYVVDSHSTDNTKEVARRLGANVVERHFVNYASQFQWALDNLPIEEDWVMRLDADEVLTQDLVDELKSRLPCLAPEVAGVNLKRRHIFLNRWIRHGGRYPLRLLRIWRRGSARIERRWMDEHMILLRGNKICFEHDFIDHSLMDLAFFTEKHNKYATREAIDVLLLRYKLTAPDASLTANGTSLQASLKRWAKERVYNNLPFWLGPFCYFSYRYVFQLGFLDGKEGLIYHFLQGYWYRFLVASKVFEFSRSLERLPGRSARLAELARLSGYSIDDLEKVGE
jgi:glycosyltransferase involved in cell wall biosynthesis